MSKTYKLVSVIETVQGEGANSGRAAVFVRFSFCDLACAFCDTAFNHVMHEWDLERLVKEITQYTTPFVVFTGGEPSLQLDKALVDALHEKGCTCAIETNGHHDVSELGLDWICVSPKSREGGIIKPADWVQRSGNELKVLFPDAFSLDLFFDSEGFDHYWVSPVMGEVTSSLNVEKAIEFIKTYPRWRLGVQAHKYLGIE
jgi:organic radical activating enzyme